MGKMFLFRESETNQDPMSTFLMVNFEFKPVQKMGHLDELPELALKRVFQFLFASGEKCHDVNTISSMRALSKGLF